MQSLIYPIFVPLLLLPAVAFAQVQAPQSSPQFAATRQIDDATQEPAVLLTPMRTGQPADAALINDMCQLKERKVQVYRLSNVAVNDVAESVNHWLQSKLTSKKATVKGFICNAPVIIVPDPVTNSLIVSVASDFEDAVELDAIIRQLDHAPNQIAIKAVIKKTVDGQTTILTSPGLILLENTTGSVSVESPEGELTIELTARVVNQNNASQTAPHTANRPADQDAEK